VQANLDERCCIVVVSLSTWELVLIFLPLSGFLRASFIVESIIASAHFYLLGVLVCFLPSYP
jgi:hypothetical protein